MQGCVGVSVFAVYVGGSCTLHESCFHGRSHSHRLRCLPSSHCHCLHLPHLFYFRLEKENKPCLGARGCWWVALTAVIGVTVNQNAYFKGLDLSSSSMACAMTNLIPAVTFIISVIVGYESIKSSMKSVAKVIGTGVCVGGAMTMTFLRGPKLLNALLNQDSTTWLLGCILLVINMLAWSLWLVFQIPIASHCPDHLYTCSCICVMATISSFLVALALGNTHLSPWKLHSFLKLSCCIYSGIQLATMFFLQAWVVTQEGPLFSALFNPLAAIITKIFGSLYLQEQTYLESLLGALAIFIGLYIVLWGKSEDYEEESIGLKLEDGHTTSSQADIASIVIGDKAFRSSELLEPLLM
ncbi:PREDICTED: WAT1-related protein At4g28040-like [Camelina sativa]|uniref:WAT1-related protein n=1 Tax=Camelina sativa TaxID=90675 RepID=A0ABM1QP44_CAMSA|nr:PREDICTED: WAT1-related protein At4g28040-like [Camelina sativa]XP_019088533.1 PREDICTED: WAT1-related protein At4g28040-like [Camelina sativa]